MLLSISERTDGWTPQIIKTVATEDKGIENLASAISSYKDFVATNNEKAGERRATVAHHRIIELLRDKLLKIALGQGTNESDLKTFAQAVANRTRDPYSVVDEIINRVIRS
jgi:LAO/AO transport system kinase